MNDSRAFEDELFDVDTFGMDEQVVKEYRCWCVDNEQVVSPETLIIFLNEKDKELFEEGKIPCPCEGYRQIVQETVYEGDESYERYNVRCHDCAFGRSIFNSKGQPLESGV